MLRKPRARWNVCRAITLAIAVVGVGAANAQAASTLSMSGATLSVQGSGGVDEVTVSYLQPAGPLDPGYTRIEDPNGGVNGAMPAGCTSIEYTGFYGLTHRAECEDGGHNGAGDPIPFIDGLVIVTGGAGDHADVEDCYDSVAIDVGEGDNHASAPACTTGAYTINAGSGVDEVKGAEARTAPFTANLGGGDDHFSGGGAPEIVHGGDGFDRIYGEGGNDQLYGEGDSDHPDGGAGDDLVDGGPGDDGLEVSLGVRNDTGVGADHYVGGPGTDRLILDAHANGVAISLNGVADDGNAGEGDNVEADVENIEGTDGNDVFTGSGGPDIFYGRLGNDVIHGGGGSDDLNGASGDDDISGDGGNDKLVGSNGADRVDGGAGNDQMYGDQATCNGVFICISDPDTLLARDGERDTVDCGGGADTAAVDDIDVVAFCGSVTTTKTDPPAGCAPPSPACPPPPARSSSSFTTSGKRSRAKGITVKVTCSGKCTFALKLGIAAKVAKKARLGKKAVTIGTARGSLAAAGSKTVILKLSAKARKKLKRLRTVAATLKLTVTDEAGAATTQQQGVKLVR